LKARYRSQENDLKKYVREEKIRASCPVGCNLNKKSLIDKLDLKQQMADIKNKVIANSEITKEVSNRLKQYMKAKSGGIYGNYLVNPMK
jgi:hypothetical protein